MTRSSTPTTHWNLFDGAFEFEPRPHQTYRVDADRLVDEPELIVPVCGPLKPIFLTLDILLATVVALGIFATCAISAWFILPTCIIGWAIIGANRRTAARLVSSSAELDPQDFAYLYRQGIIRRV